MPSVQVLTHENVGGTAMHLAPFRLDQRSLRSRLGLQCDVRVYPSVAGLVDAADRSADIFFVTTDWRTPEADLRGAIEALRGATAKPVIYFDTFDQTSSPYFGLVGSVDLYLKSKVLRDSAAYQRAFRGGNIVADYCERELGIDLGGWSFGSALDPALAQKVVPGWSFGVARRIRVLSRLASLLQRPLKARRFDLQARFSPPAPTTHMEWYQRYRALAAQAVRGLPPAIRATPSARVSQRRYVMELLSSRIVFSPFGWGEVCIRDYEAVACGCLLVKPSVEHLTTSPDIYEPYQTYVPVKWDFSDLAETCSRYLGDPAEAQRIASSARERLRRYFREGVVGDLRRALDTLERLRSQAQRRPEAQRAATLS